MSYHDKLISILEDVIVIIVMFGVFLPVRILFYSFVSENWFGSFGLISLITITMVYLSYKDKLGFFGRAYWRTISRIHKGKRRILSYTMIGFSLYLWVSIIGGVDYAENNPEAIALSQSVLSTMTPEEKQRMDALNKAINEGNIVDTNNELMKDYTSIPPELLVLAALMLIALPILDYTTWAVIVSLLNGWLNGWLLHFGTVFLIEVLEVIGILIFTYTITKKGNITVNKP